MKSREFRASWIWTKNPYVKNEKVVFRKKFDISSIPKKADTYISVDTKYFLYVNGSEVVYEGGLFRESKPGCGYYDVVDIAPYLVKGKNVIAIIVYYFGNEGRNNIDSTQAGLIFECPALELYSDSSFLCRTHPAYYTPGEPSPSYLYGGDNLGYDANREMEGFIYYDFDDSAFEPATVYENKVWGKLYERPIPLHLTKPNTPAERIRYDGKAYIADLPYAMAMFPTLEVVAKGGEKIDIRTDRYEVTGGPGGEFNTYRGHRIEYICKPGFNRFESILYLFGSNIIVTCSSPVEIKSIGYRETGYRTEIVGDFVSESELMNRLIEKSARTLYVCMRDNFMDCPDRERSQWIGDVSVQIPQVAFFLDDKARKLVRKAVMDFINLRHGDVLVGNVPGAHANELPSQSLVAISEWGLIAEYYKYTADVDVLKKAFEPMVAYLKLWKMGADGLILQRKGDWPWYDHLYNIDHSVIENCWYYSALKFALRVAEIIQDHRFDTFLNERKMSIEASFEPAFWKDTGKHLYYSSGSVVDDRANALAALVGLAPEEHYFFIRRILLTVFNATAYMENFVLMALCKMGYIADAYRRMASRYYNLATNDDSTLWEDFYILGTRNHAWTGAPATIAFRYFLGIDTNDGFKTFTIRPCYDVFEKMSCRFYAKDGPVFVSADKRHGIKIINQSSSRYIEA